MIEHTIEPASSGRAGCRGCGAKIPKDELRFGERLPNPFADGTLMTHWFHLTCAAMKRPDSLLETLNETDHEVPADETAKLKEIARLGMEHRRVPRIDGIERSPSGRATCRQCRDSIEKESWRIKLVFYEEGMFNPAGFIHISCVGDYLETKEILDRLRHFSPSVTDEEFEEIGSLLG